MPAYSARRSSNDEAAKTKETLGPPARRAAAIRASISPRTLTAAGGALNLAVVTASYQGRGGGSGTIPTREGCETPRWSLTGGLIPANAWTGTSIPLDPARGERSGAAPRGRGSSPARVGRLPP